MINFFRTIRRNLLSEGKTGKYLKYAVGEIILVMIGILLALQVNTWNESRKLESTEREFFKGVRGDLLQDKAQMDMVIQRQEKKIAIYNFLDNDFSALYNNDRNTLDSLLNIYFTSQRTFYPISGSFNSAMSSNEFNKFKSKSLKMAVIKIYNSIYARLMDNGKMTDDRWFYFVQKYSHMRRTGHIGNLSPEQLEEFRDDMFYHVFGLEYYINNLKDAISEIDAFLESEQQSWK